MRFRIFIAALLCAALLPAAASARSVPQGFVGAMWDNQITQAPAAVQDAQFARMARSGVESVRTTFLWAGAQPTPNGPFSFTATDRVVTMAAAHHLAVLPIVIEAPAWARQSPDLYSPPSDPAAYARYLTALIGRYGPRGSFWSSHPHLFRSPIRYWQIWNEPDLTVWWTQSGDWGPSYTTLLKAASQAAKRADPGAKIVLGALTNFSWRDLAHLYHLGARRWFDVVGLDPYTGTIGGSLYLVLRGRSVMNAFGDWRKPIWVTEFGLAASKGRINSNEPLQTTDAGMARYASTTLAAFADHIRSWRVERAFWYTWATPYTGTNPVDIWNYTGLFRWDGHNLSAQPAYLSFTKSVRKLEGCAKTATAGCAARHR